MTSICKDGKHVILWDFDGINMENNDLINKIKKIQAQYELSNIYLFKSSKDHYHGYCLNKFEFKDMFDIIRMTPYIDPNFLIYAAKRGESTLRISPKVKGHGLEFMTFISGNGAGEGSSAHRIFLSNMIPNAKKYFNQEKLTWDNNFDIKVVEYDTSEVKDCLRQEQI
jgi:hypothetical protein